VSSESAVDVVGARREDVLFAIKKVGFGGFAFRAAPNPTANKISKFSHVKEFISVCFILSNMTPSPKNHNIEKGIIYCSVDNCKMAVSTGCEKVQKMLATFEGVARLTVNLSQTAQSGT
jgi:hypothetical protein